MNGEIDFIIAWVNDNDKERLSQRNKYAGKDPEDIAEYRFRDWETLKYLFRGIQKFAPWVNNVFFVTCGHYPSWLNLNYPKLRFIKHEDYIPKEYLPTFNASTIELNFHRIKALSEHFVYFNDDMFLINHMNKTDFFEKGLPKQVAGLSVTPTSNEIFSHNMLSNINLINRHFAYRDIINKHKRKWYYPGYGIRVLAQTIFLQNYPCLVGLYNHHMPNPLLKSTINKLWDLEFNVLNNSSISKFRIKDMVNQYIFSRYDIASGNFIPRENNMGHYFEVKDNNTDLINSITKKKYKMICINDTSTDFDFEKAKSELITAFQKILPEKSNFEK